jgi:O-antigen ligase
MSRRVAVLLALAALGVGALVLALVIDSEVLAAAGVVVVVTAVIALFVVALFAQQPPPPERREDHSFYGWLWRQTRPPGGKRRT